MTGMNAVTGRPLSGIHHIQQSLQDILTTPIGSRVMRRDYGSLLPELIDQPTNDVTLLQIYAAIVMAVIKWEPRVVIATVKMAVGKTQPGHSEILLTGQTRDGRRFDVGVLL